MYILLRILTPEGRGYIDILTKSETDSLTWNSRDAYTLGDVNSIRGLGRRDVILISYMTYIRVAISKSQDVPHTSLVG